MNQTWIITVGGGYGSFEFVGTQEEAEAMRAHKARWEGVVATKKLKSSCKNSAEDCTPGT